MQPGSNFEARIGAVPQQRKNKQTKKDKTRQKKQQKNKDKTNKTKKYCFETQNTRFNCSRKYILTCPI